MKYYVGMSGTFRSFSQKTVTAEDLSHGKFVFGFNKNNFIELGSAIPAFVSLNNVEKPKYNTGSEFCDKAFLDSSVAMAWKEFVELIIVANREGRVEWTDGKNYPAKAKKLLESANEVFWDHQWRNAQEFKYMSDQS